jgi:hypothetical protein
MVVRFFCVGEALSIPLLRGTWHAARHPLPRAILGRIVKDEAAHGVFGFLYLDWALERHDSADIEHLGHAADRAIAAVKRQWAMLRKGRSADYDASTGDALGWMDSEEYLALAARSLEEKVRTPLLERGIPLSA